MRPRETARTPESAHAGRAPARPPAARPSASASAEGPGSPQRLAALQRSAGNAAVVRMLRGTGRSGGSGEQAGAGGPREAAGADVQRAVSSAPTVQRMRVASGTVAFTNVSAKYPEYHEKATRIIQLLTSHTEIMRYVGGRPCEITLEKRTTETPAEVSDKGERGVFVTLASYYFENYGIGHIAGMLCHEFGIHPLAESKPGLRGEEEGFRGLPMPVPGLEQEERGTPGEMPTMNSDKAKQPDHVLGAIPGSPRFNIYRDVTLEMADLLLRDVQNRQPGAREQDVTDLIDCFLMDIASIAATNDARTRGLPIVGNSEGGQVRSDIAKVYNRYKQRLSGEALGRQRLLPLFPQDKTPQTVKDDFNRLLKAIAKGKLWAWSIAG
ncbi:hypothetical protein [Streptomyces sp. NPDC059398]|uniref:hypothetical protein n=1 Tax=Streptomyces sp. NPDC059398 TaxID=3346820 RepID=UPI0036A55151